MTDPDAPASRDLFADPVLPEPSPGVAPRGERRGPPAIGVTLAVSIVVFALVLGAIIVARQPAESRSPSYDAQTRAAFVTACIAGGAETQPTCECAYDKIVQSIPYDRYLELDRQFGGQSPPPVSPGAQPTSTALPNDLAMLVVGCLAKQSVSTPPTTKPTATTGAPGSAGAPAG